MNHLHHPGIHPTAIIYPGVELGLNVQIGAYSVIGAPPEHRRLNRSGIVKILDNTVIREHAVIGAPTRGLTFIGEECYIMAHSYIAHDCYVGDNVTISSGCRLAGEVFVHHDANLGMGVTVHQRQVIGAHAMVGMGSVVVKDVLPLTCVAGNPAKFLRRNGSHENLDMLWKEYNGQGKKDEWLHLIG